MYLAPGKNHADILWLANTSPTCRVLYCTVYIQFKQTLKCKLEILAYKFYTALYYTVHVQLETYLGTLAYVIHFT